MQRQQWNLLGAAGLGAGLMYLLDPTGGGRRRALARDKAVRALHVSGDALRKSSRDLANRSKGLMAGARSKVQRGDAPDEVLAARVRSKLGRVIAHPGAVAAECHGGCVTLRGDVLAAEQDRLLAAVQGVKGVSEVVDQLTVHGSSEGVPPLQNGDGPLRRRSLPPAARLLAGTAGGALTLACLTRRDRIGAALGAAGLGLLATSGLGGDKAGGLLRRRQHGQAEAGA